MRCWVLGFVFLGSAVWLGACSKDSEPPEKFNEVLSSGQAALPPVPMQRASVEGLPPTSPARYLKKIDGAVSGKLEDLPPADAAGQKAEGEAGKPAAPAVALNDGDPKALMEQFLQFAAEGNLDGIAAAVVPDQQGPMHELAAALKTMTAGRKKLQELIAKADAELAKKLDPDEKGAISLDSGEAGATPVPFQVDAPVKLGTLGDVAVDGEKAVATLTGGPDNAEIKIDLAATDGKWRVTFPAVPPAAAIEQMAAHAKAFAAVAAKVEAGEVPPADALKELFKALQGGGEKAEPANQGEAAPEPGPKPEANAGKTRSGRDPNTEQPTAEELLTRQ